MPVKSIRRFLSLVVCMNILVVIGVGPILADSPAEQTFTYDANGNMVSGFGLTFTYNDANRLVKISNQSTGADVAEYFYDDAGSRIRKLEGGVDTYYIGEYFETRVNGTSVENTSYYFANNERVARKDPDGSRFWYHSDHLGSTSIVTDTSGNVVESVNYYPYGAIESRTGNGSKYLYTDQELDPESGLYYYGARYYSPEIMRFVEPDPVIQDVYNPQNLNKYSYVLDNPLKFNDPTGLNPSWSWTSVNLAVGGALTFSSGLMTGNLHAAYTGGVRAMGGISMCMEGAYADAVDIYDLGHDIGADLGWWGGEDQFVNHMAQLDDKADQVAQNVETIANPLTMLSKIGGIELSQEQTDTLNVINDAALFVESSATMYKAANNPELAYIVHNPEMQPRWMLDIKDPIMYYTKVGLLTGKYGEKFATFFESGDDQ